jgi:hypothetical protein
VPIQWPQVTAFVDAPPFEFPRDVSNIIGVFGVMHEMVGDVDRLQPSPSLGFQRPHTLPNAVLESWQALIADGFGRHLLTA